jgi:hypothetical protein
MLPGTYRLKHYLVAVTTVSFYLIVPSSSQQIPLVGPTNVTQVEVNYSCHSSSRSFIDTHISCIEWGSAFLFIRSLVFDVCNRNSLPLHLPSPPPRSANTGIIGAPIILGRCPTLSAQESESMLQWEREREWNMKTARGSTQCTNNSDPVTLTSALLLRQNSVTAHAHQS